MAPDPKPPRSLEGSAVPEERSTVKDAGQTDSPDGLSEDVKADRDGCARVLGFVVGGILSVFVVYVVLAILDLVMSAVSTPAEAYDFPSFALGCCFPLLLFLLGGGIGVVVVNRSLRRP